MPKKKTQVAIGVFIFLLLIASIAYFGINSTLQEKVWIPQSTNYQCTQCAEQTEINNIAKKNSFSFTSAQASFYCDGTTSKNSVVDITTKGEIRPDYADFKNGCDLTITNQGSVIGTAYRCHSGSDTCETEGKFIENSATIHLKAPFDRLFIQRFSKIKVGGTSQPYCIKSLSDTNFLDIIKGCNVGSLIGATGFGRPDFNVLKESGINPLIPAFRLDNPINIITSAREVPSQETQDIIKHPKSGEIIFVATQDGSYCKIKDDIDSNTKYADCTDTDRDGIAGIKDSVIKCKPSSPVCDETGTKIKQPEQQGESCGIFKNNPSGFLRISATQECTYSCVNNKLVKGKCQEIKPEDVNCPTGTILIGDQCVQQSKNNLALACQNSGGTWQSSESTECVDLLCFIGIKEPTKVTENKCVEGFKLGNLPIFSILIGFVIGLISILVSLSRFGTEGINLWLSLILGVVVGILVGVAWNYYWWLALIVGIVFLLLQIILGRIFGVAESIVGLKGRR